MKPAPLILWTLLAASAAGVTLVPSAPDIDREEAEKIFRNVLERVQEREHRKLLEGIDLFVDHSDWSEAVQVASKHYLIKTTNANLGRQLANRLDLQLSEMQELFQTDHLPPRGRFEVWIYPTIEMYGSLATGRADEHSSFYGSYYSTHDAERPVVCAYDLKWNWTQVPHSAVHQYIDSAFNTTPRPWISEGLAHYFALKSNRQSREWAEAEHALRAENYRPLSELIADRGLGDYVTSDAGNPGLAEEKFVQLGLFMRYLLEELPETARAVDEPEASFANYLRGVLRGREPREGFRATFLNARGLEFLDRSFRDFRFE